MRARVEIVDVLGWNKSIARYHASRNHGPTEVRSDNGHTRRSSTVSTKSIQRSSSWATALHGKFQAERNGMTHNKRYQGRNVQTTGSTRSETTAELQGSLTTVTQDVSTPSTPRQVSKTPPIKCSRITPSPPRSL